MIREFVVPWSAHAEGSIITESTYGVWQVDSDWSSGTMASWNLV